MKMVLLRALIVICPLSYEVYAQSLKNIAYAHSQVQGKRTNMEDAYVCMPSLAQGLAFFGLYDGHGGTGAAQAAAHGQLVDDKNFKGPGRWSIGIAPIHEHIADAAAEGYPDGQRIRYAFAQFERAFIQHGDQAGTTAVVAVVDTQKDQLHIGWTGDSRALIIGSDGALVYATHDHSIEDPAEAQRLQTAGAVITHYGVARIAGLAMSRSLGDRAIKLRAAEQAQGKPVIIPDPDVATFDLASTYKFCILACDGVWDVFSNEEVAALVYDADKAGVSVQKIAQLIINKAFVRGSTDNISVTVIRFDYN